MNIGVKNHIEQRISDKIPDKNAIYLLPVLLFEETA